MSTAAALILYALRQNINLFYTPTQLQRVTFSLQQTLRIGGYVKKKSVQFDHSGQSVKFIVTDRKHEINVIYHGVLPSLFREGQTVVVTGKIDSKKQLIASQVLAKHDEKYRPSGLKE